ncbi:transcriptional regulator [Oceaniradius stylonematis]|jgi:DNA-binding HxlR family transcriptional regulator|uniref:Transcriptional regulator n=1 Tax=Oceaniradius stylonematis TaxID=2184161 RepID=A0A3A8ABY0_9HYPH|nr:winged helix-turn-helix transcriptional regulator [Oceaniradius stylonematis]RKF07375.1 transcriptional regulator [Oceaniradius stylonematis]RNC96727.1 MAG: transcriptional regulator [Oricola sp.]
MDIETLVNITCKAWSLAILAALHEGVPGRQAQLLTATGAGRTAFAQSVTHLVDLGLVERNPGHGHPLRPEFRLTGAGQDIAAIAHALTEAAAASQHRDLLRRAWTVPVLALLQAPRTFNEIGRSLGSITNRALSQALKSLEACGWVTRTVDEDARPPRAFYRATATGAAIARAAGLGRREEPALADETA